MKDEIQSNISVLSSTVSPSLTWLFIQQVLNYIKAQIPAEDLEQGQDPHKITEEIFHHEDKDRDGYISHEEFSGPKHDEL